MRNPKISYKHALSEIAVNRDDPLEIVRELISNAYDANATLIRIFPFISTKTLVFFDNGIGLDNTIEIGEAKVTAFQAFFSIGTSTKPRGTAIGYKCQGSKLCFATTRTIVITRCEIDTSWRCLLIDNPRMNLSNEFSLDAQVKEDPWQFLSENLFTVQSEDAAKLKDSLGKTFFKTEFKTGTLVAMVELDAENFSDNFGISTAHPKLVEYIKFYTAHGDTRHIANQEYGFPKGSFDTFRKIIPERVPILSVWQSSGDDVTIPFGFPYLKAPESPKTIKSPLEIARLRDGRFFARHAVTINYEEKLYCLILAVDGYRRAMENYQNLSRQGGRKSGIRYVDQRGVILSAHGVRISDGTSIFSHAILKEFAELASPDGRIHYQFIIDGEWDLVTDRNKLSSSSKKMLDDTKFLEKILYFLTSVAKSSDHVLSDLLKRLKRETSLEDVEQQARRIEEIKSGLKNREYFNVKGINFLENRKFVVPEGGEENLVAALYSIFAVFIENTHPLARFWLRPLIFSNPGIDSLVVVDEARPFDVLNRMCEFKCFFDSIAEFNHPLKLTHIIIAWDFELPPQIGSKIKDAYGYWATFAQLPDAPNGIGFLLEDISNEHGETLQHKIPVVSLRSLLNQSFDLEFKTGAPYTSKPQVKHSKCRKVGETEGSFSLRMINNTNNMLLDL